MKNKSFDGQTSGLKLYAEQRSQEICKKANTAIDSLLDAGEKVTFEAVARTAGVARGTLYNYPQVKDRILTLKAEMHTGAVVEDAPVRKTKVQRLEEKIAMLTARVAQLEEDKKNLIIQLVDQEDLKEEIERLRRVLRGGRV